MFGPKFRDLAVSLVEKFAAENGSSVIRLRQHTPDQYDPTTGVRQSQYDEVITPVAYIDIKDVDKITTSSDNITMVAYVPGDMIPRRLMKGDEIIDHNGIVFSVVDIDADMYDAIYVCYLK